CFIGMHQDRGAEPVCERRRLVDVVVVGVGAHDGRHPPVPDLLRHRLGVVCGIDEHDLPLVADDPDVVLDLPASPVEGEGSGGHQVLDRAHRTTTERSTPPRCILSKAPSTSSRGISSVMNLSNGSLPCRYRSIRAGKSRDGRQSPYQEDFSAPPWEKYSSSGSFGASMSGVGTPTRTTVPPRSRARKACFHVSGIPTASITTSAPKPPV